jgi:hypothetical protein
MVTDTEALDRADMEQLKAGDDDALNRLWGSNPVASFVSMVGNS